MEGLEDDAHAADGDLVEHEVGADQEAAGLALDAAPAW